MCAMGLPPHVCRCTASPYEYAANTAARDRAPHLAGGAHHRAQQRQRQPLLRAVKHEVVGGGAGGQHP